MSILLLVSTQKNQRNRTYLSGRCSPSSRISRTRSRYWYSSCLLVDVPFCFVGISAGAPAALSEDAVIFELFGDVGGFQNKVQVKKGGGGYKKGKDVEELEEDEKMEDASRRVANEGHN